MDLFKISAGKNLPDEVNAIIDISANSTPVKYQIDEEFGFLSVDRFIPVSMNYPCNYGFIPHIKGGDGDFMDILVITRYPIIPKSVIRVRPIGVLITEDEEGEDAKILSVPITKVDPYYKNIQNYSDLPKIQTAQIEHFFIHYKDLESEKYVKVKGWENADFAKSLIDKGSDN